MIAIFGGPTPPSPWLICDGSPVSRTTYAALFTVIGTYWGPGDNVTTFNLPDLRGRTPIGYVNSAAPGMTARTFGALGGEETHFLSVAEMPNHGHTLSDGTHNHTLHDPQHTHNYNDAWNPPAAAGVSGGATMNVGAANLVRATAAAGTGISIDPTSSNISIAN